MTATQVCILQNVLASQQFHRYIFKPAPSIDNLYEYTRLSNFDKASDPEKEEENQEVCVCVWEMERKERMEREQHIQPEEMTTGNDEWT